jgi:hypothetical protein
MVAEENGFSRVCDFCGRYICGSLESGSCDKIGKDC